MQTLFKKSIISLCSLGLVLSLIGCGDGALNDTPPNFVPIGTDVNNTIIPNDAYTGPSALILQTEFESQLPAKNAPIVAVSGDITTSQTWTKDNVYHLTSLVKVKGGVTLSIQAGTTVIADPTAYLVIVKDSRLYANGTTSEPIIFDSKSHYDGGRAGAGQWGGVTLLGNANVNEANLRYEVDEADVDFDFGSFNDTTNNTEDRGVLNNIKILNSGFAVAENKEVNGLSLCGIGSGTTVDNISIINSGDDGVEIWGGTVNLNNITIINALDDSFDVDNGYTGRVTNLKVVQVQAAAAGVEMTNSGDATVLRTNLTIDGFEIITAAVQKKEGGLYFKDEDTTGTFANGRIIHYGLDGAFHSRVDKAMLPEASALLSFSNIKVEAVGDLYGGPTDFQSVYEAQLPVFPSTIIDVTGDIVNASWTKDNVYRLTNRVKVSGALNIEAGTTIIGTPLSYLVILKGATITANGTASEPIVFDSETHFNGASSGAGQWGGVTLLGNAQVNEFGLFYEVDEADPDFSFGDTSSAFNAESSGSMSFVEILNSGFAVAENKEVNGLSLCAIGSGTTIEDITIINSGDDGVELWGGTVNLTNVKIVNALDDSFDIDNGYTGTVTNLDVIQAQAAAGGVEMTNSGDASIVRSNPTFEGYRVITAATQKKEGGLYFKDKDTTGTFNGGLILHYGLDGALHSREEMAVEAQAALSFSNSLISY